MTSFDLSNSAEWRLQADQTVLVERCTVDGYPYQQLVSSEGRDNRSQIMGRYLHGLTKLLRPRTCLPLQARILG
jgi:hypothetical protein